MFNEGMKSLKKPAVPIVVRGPTLVSHYRDRTGPVAKIKSARARDSFTKICIIMNSYHNHCSQFKSLEHNDSHKVISPNQKDNPNHFTANDSFSHGEVNEGGKIFYRKLINFQSLI